MISLHLNQSCKLKQNKKLKPVKLLKTETTKIKNDQNSTNYRNDIILKIIKKFPTSEVAESWCEKSQTINFFKKNFS